MKDTSVANPGNFLSTEGGKTKSNSIEIPSISLPKGGGAIRGIDEKFSVNAVNGTSSFTIPIPFSKARAVSPSLNISYNSGAGNGIFGLGWSLGLASIKRKTDNGLPQYNDGIDSDTFLFSEAEDLVPELKKDLTGNFITLPDGSYVISERDSADGLYRISNYKPRIEGLYARIEKWTASETGEVRWRIITRDNITTLFGWSPNARIADPANPAHIFEWFPEFIYDDKGNCSHYLYRQENASGLNATLLHNRNRLKDGTITYANCYPEKLFYGNKTPYKGFGETFPREDDYLFQTVFDYGTLSPGDAVDSTNIWDFRTDAFSDYKAGFEVRTTRLCKRILLFHVFEELALKQDKSDKRTLVKSLNFKYDIASEQDFTFLNTVTSFGYIKKPDGTYSFKKLPPLEFAYQKHDWNAEIKKISYDAYIHAPVGPDEQPYQFTDLYNEGMQGILSEQAYGWYYKRNLGNGAFEPAHMVSPKPSFSGLGVHLHLADLDADGGKQLVSFGPDPAGFFELDDRYDWQNFRSFRSLPNIDFSDPNTRMLDLNGDGRPEVLISGENVFTWYESEGRNGFATARQTIKPADEESGPHVIFADKSQSIYLADMSGDGLTDILRIRNGEVCYWPNLGYGKFGNRIVLDNSPLFDHPDHFNPTYLRLADIDGSGTSDIVYLGKNKFTCWKNLSGNRFSTIPFEIVNFPDIHTYSKITVTDLLGNGVACIVWSSPLEKDAQAPWKYIDLMNGKKPHVLISYKNNMGKVVSLDYTPSTTFYLEDKANGRPWTTKLHFPVHCVSRTTTEDRISGYQFMSTYKYHHGYYDHDEKEFRGFGMVEQTDSETFEHWKKRGASNITEATLHQEPVVLKTWNHTGAFLQQSHILDQFEKDYWYEEMGRQGIPVVHHETKFAHVHLITAPGVDPELADKLSVQDWQEAMRACKGMQLRSENFAKDAARHNNSPEARQREFTPYSVTTQNCEITLIQPRGKNNHAIFAVKQSESITYTYERNAEDPRISHSLNLRSDKYGHVLESASVVYPRLQADATLPAETRQDQNKTVIIYTQNEYTNDVLSQDTYQLRLPSEVKIFELKGVAKTGTYYSAGDFADILSPAKSDTVLYFELDKPLIPGKAQKRLIEKVRSLYYRSDLTGSLPLHQLASPALAYESYQLAFTPELLNDIYSPKATAAALADLMVTGEFGHTPDETGNPDTDWWIRSGTIQFKAPAETLTDSQNRFYVPVSYTDPFRATTKVKYYKDYYLFIKETEDPLGNVSKIENADPVKPGFNFRTLSPDWMKDINGNYSTALSDELGLIKAVAVMGKGHDADTLDGITEMTDSAEADLIQQFFKADDSVQLTTIGKTLLAGASSRFVYDFDMYTSSGKPAVAATISRERHFNDMQDSPVQITFEYSNGLGEVVMTKGQAEPGKAKIVIVQPDDTYNVTDADTSLFNPVQLRWIGNGRTVKNNKGSEVKKYEPYFSTSWQYEDYKELVEMGVSPLMYYDATGRLIKTESPDGAFSTVKFDAWKQIMYDANDNVLESDWYKKRTDSIHPEFITDTLEHQAASKAARHAATPNEMHFDVMGRPVLTIDHNKNGVTGADEFYYTRVNLDTEGNLLSVTDARGNTVVQYKYNMLGAIAHQHSMDAGQRWLLFNVSGKPLRTWDERDHEFQYNYDIAQRPVYSKVVGGDGPAPLDHIFDKAIYGESLLTSTRTDGNRANEPALQARNILGQVAQLYDTGGLLLTPDYDFKGQALTVTRKLFRKYKEVANWTDVNLTNDLEPGPGFLFRTQTDALGRITRQEAPDGSIILPWYNASGLLNGETVQHPGAAATIYLKDIDYNAKGQREKIIFGNDVSTRFTYDKDTFRIKNLKSRKLNGDVLQDLLYTFDAVGNITHILDNAIPINFFSNAIIEPLSEYTYDALYRLVAATGRENSTALNFGSCDNWNDKPFRNEMNPGNPMAVRGYTQRYRYDPVGNLEEMSHLATNGNWTRTYAYESTNNRLVSTRIGNNGNSSDYTRYRHHARHGYMEELPHLEKIAWNFKEEVILTTRQHCTEDHVPVITYYQYDGKGQRIRKITENQAAAGSNPTVKEERIYISGYELYKKHTGSHAGLERVSLSLMDKAHRFVMIETRNHVDDGSERTLVRYQLHNHVGSAALELDGTTAANVISYEEYHPFGTTAYQAKNAAIASTAKRYRYTGMERDEETGLEYHSARYYLPWLGRWLSSDPIWIRDGVNLYAYCKDNPVVKNDKEGTQAAPVVGSERIVAALEAANRANYDIDSVNHAINVIQAEIDSRGFSYNFTRDAVLTYTLLRAEAYARNAALGNYGQAAFYGTMGVIDSFGYSLYGDTPGETARNFAISLVVGATISRLAAVGRVAQMDVQASSDVLAARVAARRASISAPPPVEPPVSTVAPPPQTTVTPPVETPAAPGTTTGRTSAPPIDPDATPPHGTRIPTQHQPRLLTTERDGFFAMSDSSNPRFQASGELSHNGTLTVTMRTTLDGARSTVLRGAEAFQGILRHFGSAIRTIRGSWKYGTNLEAFNRLTAEGMSPEAAAARTWTGQQAARAGFTEVTVQSLDGSVGNYTNVQVTFTRPH